MKRLSILSIVGLLLVLSIGCGTVVPPGKKVILMHPNGENEVFDKGSYFSWGRTKVYQVDQKLQSFEEDLQILCADDINMTVELKALLSFDVSDENKLTFIREKVPSIQPEGSNVDGELSLDKFYEMAIRDIVRSSARNIMSVEETDTIRPKRQDLEKEISQLVTSRIAELKYPILISACLISNIDYPLSVITQREKIKEAELKDEELAALADSKLAEVQRSVAIEEEEAKVRMIKAQAQADENRILTESLTPEFLMWRQFEVMETISTELAKGDSNTVFMMPYQTMSPDMLNTAVIKSSVDSLKTVAK